MERGEKKQTKGKDEGELFWERGGLEGNGKTGGI